MYTCKYVYRTVMIYFSSTGRTVRVSPGNSPRCAAAKGEDSSWRCRTRGGKSPRSPTITKTRHDWNKWYWIII